MARWRKGRARIAHPPTCEPSSDERRGTDPAMLAGKTRARQKEACPEQPPKALCGLALRFASFPQDHRMTAHRHARNARAIIYPVRAAKHDLHQPYQSDQQHQELGPVGPVRSGTGFCRQFVHRRSVFGTGGADNPAALSSAGSACSGGYNPHHRDRSEPDSSRLYSSEGNSHLPFWFWLGVLMMIVLKLVVIHGVPFAARHRASVRRCAVCPACRCDLSRPMAGRL